MDVDVTCIKGETKDMKDHHAVLWVHVTLPESEVDDVLAMLRSLVGPAEAHPLCVRCVVERDRENPTSLTVRHEWISDTDMLRHVRDHDRRSLLEAIDLASKDPEIRLETGSTTVSGIDVLTNIDEW